MQLALGTGGNLAPPFDQKLSHGQQVAAGISVVLTLCLCVFLSQSLIPFVVILGLLISILVIRNPVASIFSFILSNFALQFRPISMVSAGMPGLFELVIAFLMSAILFFWIVRMRFIEAQPFSESWGQLCMMLFAIWSIFVTLVMSHDPQSSFPAALREMIDFVPLLILPFLFSQFIEHDSKSELFILMTIIVSSLIMIAWNILQVRNNAVAAIYLYQIGRGNTDNTLAVFTALLAVSIMMTYKKTSVRMIAGFILLLAATGIIISLKRNLYVATILCTCLVLFWGTNHERIKAVKVLLLVGISAIGLIFFFFYTSHIFHLIITDYGLRFLSTKHLGTDISLVDRYIEWRSEWQYIIRSPILGHGFGTPFRTYDIIFHYDVWRNYSHSSYLYMIFKTGFIGAILFFGAYFSFLGKGLSLIRMKNLSPKSKVIVRAITAYLIVILINALTEPEFDSKTDLIWVGVMWGYLLALEKFQERHLSLR